MKYIQFAFKLNLCNYCDIILNITMQILCIKHEHSRMSFKKCFIRLDILNIDYVHISFILIITWNLCDFVTNLGKLDFAQNLYKPIKLGNFMMFLEKCIF
jgi:hypothetical protein